MPLLSIVTRTFNRPKALYRNIRSVAQIDDDDYEHVIIFDLNPRGVKWANKLFHAHKDRIRGDYVYILDDDDFLVAPWLVRQLRKIILSRNPDVIMVKMRCENIGKDLPDYWEEPVAKDSRIGSSCFIVRNSVWKKHIEKYGGGTMGDFRFIKSILNSQELYKLYWWDVVVAYIPKPSYGAEE